MRTSLNTIYAMLGNNLNKIASDMARINTQISSGMKMSKLSDDPVNLVGALGFRTTLVQIGQYQDNMIFGNSMISASEDALTGIKELVMDSKQQGLIAINDSQTPETRLFVAEEIHVYLERAVSIANTRWDGKYVFGGARTTGYTDTEPSPFMLGYIDGYRISGAKLDALDYNVAGPPAEYQLVADDLEINGIAVSLISSDGVSDVYDTASAAAKAAAINTISEETGVTAEVTPAFHQATAGVSAGTMTSLDLVINGTDIFEDGDVDVVVGDSDNALIDAINAKQASTGVVATRDVDGKIALKAVDGRNIHIETSINGNNISHLNDPTGAQDKVYFGTVQLASNRTFILESTLTPSFPPGGTEPALEALGLAGGVVATGELSDVENDGKLSVHTIAKLDNSVRYSGDREKNAEIKIGIKSSIEVAKNGQDAVVETGVFDVLKKLEDALRGQNYTSVTGIHEEADRYSSLESINDSKELLDEKFQDGVITVTVVDHDAYPPTEFEMLIPVDISNDTPYVIANKLNGIPGITSSWDDSDMLTIASSDPGRYTFSVNGDTSNTLKVFGMGSDQFQHQAISRSLAELEGVTSALSTRIAEFGAKANGITIQSQIYSNLELANQENLSEKQDVDLTKALLELNSKEIAYQAALSAAARTMRLSLVDYL